MENVWMEALRKFDLDRIIVLTRSLSDIKRKERKVPLSEGLGRLVWKIYLDVTILNLFFPFPYFWKVEKIGKSSRTTHVSLEAPACLHVGLAEFAGEGDSFVDLLLGKLVFQSFDPLLVSLEKYRMEKVIGQFRRWFSDFPVCELQIYDS